MTPEGGTKRLIYALLAEYDILSAGAMSIGGLPDVVGHYLGMFFAIEAKALGKKPSGLQALQISAIASSGGAVFVVDGEATLKAFQEWLEKVKAER